MNKKFLSLVLALVMVLGTFGSVFAETKAPEAKDAKKSEVKVPEKKDTNEKVQWLVDNEVVAGRTVNKDDKNADLALDKNIQRAEVTKLLIYAIGQQDLAKRLDGLYAPYKDVPSNHWANGLIAAGSTVASPANALPFLHGVGHNMFEPERQVRYDELAKMLVVLVKEDLTKAGLEAAKWPTDWMNWAAKLGIFDGIKTPVDGSKYAVREDAFVMLYNALYKLGELRNLPAGETMGIISEATANKITLNQGDLKKEFTVSANTNFVPNKYVARGTSEAINWFNAIAADSTYYVGSLVRVIADDKGNVSHIVQLGNPTDLAVNDSQGWVAVADHQVETTTARPNAIVGKDLETITVNGTPINTISTTRYFVADYAKNQLTEVKDANAALKLFNSNRNFSQVKRVYVGYDTLKNSGINEAKVVVFNKVDKDNNDSTMIRVTKTPTNDYKVYGKVAGYYAPETKGYNVRDFKDSFPINYLNLQPYDIVDLYNDHADFVIDYSEANVYKVAEVNKEQIKDIEKVKGRKIELKLEDKNGYTKSVDILADADLFFGSEIEKGAKVQVRWENANETAVNVVSVVPQSTELKGILTNAEAPNEVKGIVRHLVAAGTDRWTFDIENEDGRVLTGYVVYGQAAPFADGDKVAFNAVAGTHEDHGLAVARNVRPLVANADLDPVLTEIRDAANLSPAEKAALAKEAREADSAAEATRVQTKARDLNAVKGEAGKLEGTTVTIQGTKTEAAVQAAITPGHNVTVKSVEFTEVDKSQAKVILERGEATAPATITVK
ncbi:MAG: hypothetical protein KHZ78_07915 [Peptoniphilus sp. oral taxon 375]|nr:hypothetical protein [Peptoniphilus sp. oral taxon 375]